MPHMVLYLLDHHYPHEDCTHMLKDELALLRSVSEPLDFRFGLADFVGEKWVDTTSHSSSDSEFNSWYQEEFRHFRTLTGSRIHYEIDRNWDPEEIIPPDFLEAIEAGPILSEKVSKSRSTVSTTPQ